MPDGGDRREAWRLHTQAVKAALRDNAESVVERLMGKPERRRGHEWEYPGALGVAVTGPDRGKWHTFSGGQGGTLPELIMWKLSCDFGQAMRWAEDALGMARPGRSLSERDRAAAAARLDEARRRHEAEVARDAARKAARQGQVARRAGFLWGAYAASPATREHPYVARKGVDPDGLRVSRRGVLLVPMRDEAGRLWSLQRIRPDGDKRSLKGGRTKGCFHVLGDAAAVGPVAFAEGLATGRSVHEATGLPVVVCFSAGNMAAVVRAWREREPDRPLLVAGDNDHAKPAQGKPNVGAETAERLRDALGAVPVLPPFEAGDPGKDWNDYHQAHGPEAVRDLFARAVAEAAVRKETAPMPDGSAVASASLAQEYGPPDPRVLPEERRILTEAFAVEAVRVGAAKDAKAAVRSARTMVAGMSDEQVVSTLASVEDRVWAVRKNGTVNPAVMGAAEAVRKVVGEGAPAASAAAPPPEDPMVALVRRLREVAEGAPGLDPDLRGTIAALAAKGDAAFGHAGLRTRVAWAVMDLERATGRRIEMPEHLRQEMEGRMLSYPGLEHQGAQQLLRRTAGLASAGLVREIRSLVTKVAREGNPDTVDVADRIETLERKARVLGGESAPAPKAPEPQQPSAAAPPKVEPVMEARSPGPGEQPAAQPAYAGQPKPQSPSTQPVAQQAVAADAAGGARRGVAGGLLSRMRRRPEGDAPWDRVMSGLGERIAAFEGTVADRRSARLVSEAEASGRAAVEALERLAAGPGREVLGRVRRVGLSDPGGIEAVIAGMRAGGEHEGLRRDFDALLARPEFAKQYGEAVGALRVYGGARAEQMADFAERGRDLAQAVPLERLDARLGEEAGRLPGRGEGQSALDELAAKAADLLRKAVAKIREVVVGARAEAGPTPSPGPSP